MSKAPVNNNLSYLHRQIADIASKIKSRHSSSSFAPTSDEVYELRLKPVSKVENQAYELISSEVNLVLLEQNFSADSGYAAESYALTDKSDNHSTVVEGLVFEYNKEYDFKV